MFWRGLRVFLNTQFYALLHFIKPLGKRGTIIASIFCPSSVGERTFQGFYKKATVIASQAAACRFFSYFAKAMARLCSTLP
jgi:hypothetical protein